MSNSTKLILVIVIIVVILAAIWYAFGRKPAEEPMPETKQPIKIGAILPLTGLSSQIGQNMREGINLAVEEINNAGGINNRKVEIIYEDSQADSKLGVSAYHKLVEIQDIKIILSSISGITLGIAPLAEQNKIIVFSIGGAAPQITEAGDYIFRNNLLPQSESRFLAEFVINNLGYRKVAILAVNTESGKGYSDIFKSTFEQLDGEIPIVEMYEKGTTDFRTSLTKIADKEPEAILAGSYPSEIGYIVKQGRELDIESQFLSIYAAESPQLLEIGGEAAEELIYTYYAYDFDNPLEATQQFKQFYMQKYKKEPGHYSALAFDSIKILAKIIGECENPENTNCLKEGLYRIKDYSGATGSTTIDSNGDTDKAVMIKTIKNGQFVPYEK